MTLPERSISPDLAEAWIRESLRVDPRGAHIDVSGSCMEPALVEGARVLLKPGPGPVRLGDVVLLRTPGGLRLHRVLLRFGDRIRTKGDRGTYLDPAGSAGDIIAICDMTESRALRVVRAACSLVRVLTRPGWAFLRPGLARTQAGTLP